MILPSGIARSLETLRAQRGLARREGLDMEETLRRIVAVLGRAGAGWTLAGAHAVNVYARPRATEDFDVIVEGRKLQAVLEELEREFGPQRMERSGPVVRLPEIALDLIRSDTHSVFRRALEGATDREGIRVPRAEALVALKFLAATSLWREPADRKQDAADLIRVYQAAAAAFDRAAATELAAAAYPGADRDLAALLDRVDRGEDVAL